MCVAVTPIHPLLTHQHPTHRNLCHNKRNTQATTPFRQSLRIVEKCTHKHTLASTCLNSHTHANSKSRWQCSALILQLVQCVVRRCVMVTIVARICTKSCWDAAGICWQISLSMHWVQRDTMQNAFICTHIHTQRRLYAYTWLCKRLLILVAIMSTLLLLLSPLMAAVDGVQVLMDCWL